MWLFRSLLDSVWGVRASPEMSTLPGSAHLFGNPAFPRQINRGKK
jgi:hypothetical protein